MNESESEQNWNTLHWNLPTAPVKETLNSDGCSTPFMRHKWWKEPRRTPSHTKSPKVKKKIGATHHQQAEPEGFGKRRGVGEVGGGWSQLATWNQWKLFDSLRHCFVETKNQASYPKQKIVIRCQQGGGVSSSMVLSFD